MYFSGKIRVTIANKILQTVAAVSISNDSKTIGTDCDITLPLNSRIQYKDGKHDYLTDYTRNLFKSGDAVTIVAFYEDMPELTVFEGYVVDFVEGTPMKIKCMDKVFLLNQTTLDIHYASVTLKALAERVLQGTGMTLALPTIDLNLQNITFRLMSPAAIFEWIKNEIGLNISINGNELYINIASNTLSVVKFATDRNVMKSDLQKPSALFLKLKLKAWFIREDGTKDSFEVGDENGQLREVFFYRIARDQAVYKKMAEEALLKYKQYRYHGTIETYLYPDCPLFSKVQYTDIRYPDKNGNYVCIGNNLDIGAEGYHRKIKLSSLSDI